MKIDFFLKNRDNTSHTLHSFTMSAPLSLIGEGRTFPDQAQAQKIHDYSTSYRVQLAESLREKACGHHRSADHGGWTGLGNAVGAVAFGTAYRIVKAISPTAPKTESGNSW